MVTGDAARETVVAGGLDDAEGGRENNYERSGQLHEGELVADDVRSGGGRGEREKESGRRGREGGGQDELGEIRRREGR